MTENVQVPYNPTPGDIKTKKYERKLILFKEKLEAQLEMKQAELEAKDKKISFMEASKQFEEHVLREELEEVSKDKQEYYMTVKTQSRLLEKREEENRELIKSSQNFKHKINREKEDYRSKLDQKENQIQELTAELSETINIEEYEKMRNKFHEKREELIKSKIEIEKLEMDVKVISKLRDTATEAIVQNETYFNKINNKKDAVIKAQEDELYTMRRKEEELEKKIKELDTSTIVLGDSITHQAKYIKGLQDFLTKKGIDYQKENFKIELSDNRKKNKKRRSELKETVKD